MGAGVESPYSTAHAASSCISIAKTRIIYLKHFIGSVSGVRDTQTKQRKPAYWPNVFVPSPVLAAPHFRNTSETTWLQTYLAKAFNQSKFT